MRLGGLRGGTPAIARAGGPGVVRGGFAAFGSPVFASWQDA